MDVLVIGGSVFVGRAMVTEALAAGAHVTVFNRGRSGPGAPDVEQVVGDRTSPSDLAQLAGRRFDLVIDTCGFVPAEVGMTADLLARTCDFYAFVSSISVYPGWPASRSYGTDGTHDGQPDDTRDTIPSHVREHQHYGYLKVGCERAVERAFGAERCSLLRAGAIVGPNDSVVGRLPWWLDRFARGGDVLVPGRPADSLALVDARDIARFALRRAAGTVECGGPAGRDTWGGFVGSLASATGGDARPTWVDGAWLAQQAVEGWTEVPLWVDPAEGTGVWSHDNAAAADAGFTWRPLADTVADTWAWQRDLPEGWRSTSATPGLTPHRERALLAAWHTR